MSTSHARLYVLESEPAESQNSAGFAVSGVHSLVATMVATEPVAIFPDSLAASTAARASLGNARAAWTPNHFSQLAITWATRAALSVNIAALVAALTLAIAPMVLPIQVYSVLSGSMTPTIPVGAVVVDQAIPVQQLRQGDVITFNPPGHPGVLVTHRIHSLKQDGIGADIITKGDANPTPDSWELSARGTGYREVFDVPVLGYFVVWAQSLVGRVALVLVPALLLVALHLLESWWDRTPRESR